MRKITYILGLLLVLLSGVAGAQVNTWQAQQGYIASIQNQLNNIQNQINSFLLPPSATAGQFVVMNAGGTAFVAVGLSGDVSASITTPGSITVNSSSATTFTTKNITANSVGGPYGISKLNWNNLIDVRAYGCHGDLKQSTTVTTTNGSTTLTATGSPWVSTDCNSSHGAGCTGTVDKAIRIENSGAGAFPAGHYNTFVGTIVGFTNANQITLSNTYPASPAGEAGDSAEWATPDDACMTSIASSGGATNSNAINVYDSVPIALTSPVTFNHSTGTFWCNGMAAQESDSTNQQGGFVWFGTTPDQNAISINDSWGFRMVECQLVGATSSPPLFGIRLFNSIGAVHPNAFNSLDHVSVGGFGLLGFGIDDNGNGGYLTAMAGNHIAGDTSITMASTTALPFLGPGNPILIRDLNAGNEVIFTSSSYVRGANPIVLAQGMGKAHTAANATFIWGQAPVTIGAGWDWNGTQNDRNDMNRVMVRNADIGIMVGQGNVTAQINQPNVNGALLGLVGIGGHIQVNSAQWDGTCWVRNLTNNSEYVELNPSTQKGTNDSCGPYQLLGYSSPVVGTGYDLVVGTNGEVISGLGGAQVKVIGGVVNFGANVDPNGSIIDTGSSASAGVQIDYEDVGIGLNQASGGAPPAGVLPAIHVWDAALANRKIKWSWWTNNRTLMPLTVLDAGIGDNRSLRDITLCEVPFSGGDLMPCVHKILRGADTWTDAPNFDAKQGNLTLQGEQDITAVDAPQAPTVTCAVAGASQYRFKVTYKTHDGFETAAGPETTLGSCATPVNATNNFKVFANPVRGAEQLCVYRTVAGGAIGTEGFAECCNVGTTPTNGNFPTTCLDTIADGSLGTAPPTVGNTGQLNVSGLTTASGGVVNGCNWSVALSAGVGATSVPCLANFSNVAITGVSGGAAATTLATPAATPAVIVCAQPTAQATSVSCVASTANATPTVHGIGY